MSEYRGKYSGSGRDPVPARGSYMEETNQDSGKQPQPKQPDFSGGMSAKKPGFGLGYVNSDGDGPNGVKY